MKIPRYSRPSIERHDLDEKAIFQRHLQAILSELPTSSQPVASQKQLILCAILKHMKLSAKSISPHASLQDSNTSWLTTKTESDYYQNCVNMIHSMGEDLLQRDEIFVAGWTGRHGY